MTRSQKYKRIKGLIDEQWRAHRAGEDSEGLHIREDEILKLFVEYAAEAHESPGAGRNLKIVAQDIQRVLALEFARWYS